ncbi:uncharacterized protein BT62DRAFT_330070 [Guyanagaster necrorhizus]|uniref:Uncharacterized protein n=1 Tax=Guyanagaster necrorhizus TaxID=856835 RepID=A0A9P7VMM9_9AGAR|nr:uncharacterized protein BT62DRAFT_330070 [Guyanagaster necrorhizus MCA 3950]KAG7443417.1 hypothetical protein BT62DRAFT_330070 [Guyanagaster necrorhizus MCA 3950]
MNYSSNPWSSSGSPPPRYNTFPDDDAGPSNERMPLNPQKIQRFRKCSSLKAIIILLLLTGTIWHFIDDYSNIHRSDVQERIRHREKLERLKRIENEDAQRKLAHEREDEERRLTFEEEDQWRKEEREKQDRAIEREEAQRKRRLQQEDDQRRRAHEEEDNRRKVEKEREDRAIQAREILVARREQAVQVKDDAMREDEERRKRAALTWHDLTAEKRCLGYEKRMYHADLINIPYGEDAQSWCMRTAIDIHGVTYDHPEFCTKERQDGAVRIVGHWTVTSNEPTCKTWWGNHKKKGCHGSHKMRVEAQMFNHQEPWDNWAEMCFSTPSEFAWDSFPHPDTCENKGKHGIICSWFIDVDESECP